ncbi:MAG: sugar ABC transporter ATP-binding protein [Shinella sp.]|nr:sugar ABC transporter ATP-binding protein [Shinella sp.]
MIEQAAAEIAPAQHDDVLRVEGLSKSYGRFAALKDVSLTVRRGTIHGLLGENGAGKSTLVGLISGQRQPTGGRILLNGMQVQGHDVKQMEKAGVFLVTQEPMIVDHMTAAENLLLGIWPHRRGFIDWNAIKSDATRMLEGTEIDPGALAGKLDAVSRRKLNILRAMFSGGKIIILDEPTTSLNVDARRQLFDFMRRLRGDGVTFIFISHYNDEILEICDAVSVLRDGQLAGNSDRVSEMTSDQLSELVLGRGLSLFQRERTEFADDASGFLFSDVRGRNVNIGEFRISAGEIVGFAGLPGSGAKELARSLFGLHATRHGRMQAAGEAATALPRNPSEAYRKGIAFLSDDRRRDGLIGHLSIGQNMSLSSLFALSRRGFIDRRAEDSIIHRYFSGMGVKAASPDVPIDTLSGGNQQKVCLGRVMATDPRILILDEPTRGIDVGVKQDVHRIIDRLSREGVAVIVVTTDSDEMIRLVDRVCIFAGGRIERELRGDQITKERLREIGGE